MTRYMISVNVLNIKCSSVLDLVLWLNNTIPSQPSFMTFLLLISIFNTFLCSRRWPDVQDKKRWENADIFSLTTNLIEIHTSFILKKQGHVFPGTGNENRGRLVTLSPASDVPKLELQS